ncbi:MAG: FAD binding domain-containing protein [Thermoplasmatota archaeon]
MLLPPFALHEPTTVREAAALARQFAGSCDIVAGGTDLLPNYKWGLNARPNVISLGRVAELRRLSPDRIGAMVRLVEVERSAEIRSAYPVLAETAHLIASPLLRNMGTVGGNVLLDNRCFYFNQSYLWRAHKDFCLKADGDKCLVVPQKEKCYATFSADLPAPLLALDASFEFVGPDGTRSIRARDFYQGDGIERNGRKPGEILTAVTLPSASRSLRAAYEKLRLRGSFDFPECGIAVAVNVHGGRLSEFTLVANALETIPRVLDEVTAGYLDRELDEAAFARLGADVSAAVQPVRNTSFPPAYRKKMAGVLAKRALRRAMQSST